MSPAPTSLRRAIVHLVEHASDPTILLIVADALREAACEAALRGDPAIDLDDLATIAQRRAALLSPIQP